MYDNDDVKAERPSLLALELQSKHWHDISTIARKEADD